MRGLGERRAIEALSGVIFGHAFTLKQKKKELKATLRGGMPGLGP